MASVGGHSELLERAAPTDPSQAVLDGRTSPRAIDHHLPATRTRHLVGGQNRSKSPTSLAASSRRRIAVHDGDRGGAGPRRQLGHHQAHGARAVDQVVLAHPARQQVVTPDRARQRLDQGGQRQVDPVREPVHVPRPAPPAAPRSTRPCGRPRSRPSSHTGSRGRPRRTSRLPQVQRRIDRDTGHRERNRSPARQRPRPPRTSRARE